MTIPEITAYVMALPVEELRRLTATEIMGWVEGTYPAPGDVARWQANQRDGLGGVYVKWGSWEDEYGECIMYQKDWRPDIDRNHSRQVTDKVKQYADMDAAISTMDAWLFFEPDTLPLMLFTATPDQESRAALIAHMIHAEESYGDTA